MPEGAIWENALPARGDTMRLPTLGPQAGAQFWPWGMMRCSIQGEYLLYCSLCRLKCPPRIAGRKTRAAVIRLWQQFRQFVTYKFLTNGLGLCLQIHSSIYSHRQTNRYRSWSSCQIEATVQTQHIIMWNKFKSDWWNHNIKVGKDCNFIPKSKSRNT